MKISTRHIGSPLNCATTAPLMIIALAMIFSTRSAHAQIVSETISLPFSGPSSTSPGLITGSQALTPPQYLTATVDVELDGPLGLPFVQATSTSGNVGNEISNVSGSLTYGFELVGPSAALVDFTGSYSVSATGSAQTTASASVYVGGLGGGGYNTGWGVNAGGSGSEVEGGNYDLQYEIDPNVELYVGLGASVRNFDGPGTASAYVDPMISIDPIDISSGDYIEVFGGVGNGPTSVPDSASTMALVGGAFAGLAALRRRFAK
jgi:protein with PEP-CTERM/exosortase system signal